MRMVFGEDQFNNIPPQQICAEHLTPEKGEHPERIFIQRLSLFYTVCRMNDSFDPSSIVAIFDEVGSPDEPQLSFQSFRYEGDGSWESLAHFFTKMIKPYAPQICPTSLQSFDVTGHGCGQQTLKFKDSDVVGVLHKKADLKSFIQVVRKQIIMTNPAAVASINEEMRREWKQQLFNYWLNGTHPEAKRGFRADPFNLITVLVEPMINRIIENKCTVPDLDSH